MDNNRKWYYKFSAEESIKNEDGTASTKKHDFAILKPNRRIREDGELFYASETSRFAKAGVLPKAAWNTILSNGGGTVSESDREEYGRLLIEYRDKSFDLQSILIKTQGQRNEQQQTEFDRLTTDLEEIRRKVQAFESTQINIFENTAEAKARNRAILWWVTNLSYKLVEDKFVPIFDAPTFEARLDKYDEIEQADNEEFLLLVLRRITYLITLWFLGRVEKDSDFIDLDSAFLNSFTATQEDTDSASTEPSAEEAAKVTE
jgi:hypothetical protein